VSNEKDKNNSSLTKNPFNTDFPIPETVGVLPLNEPVIFPQMISPIQIRNEEQMRLLESMAKKDRMIAIFPTIDPDEAGHDDAGPKLSPYQQSSKLMPVGTLCTILRILRIPDGTMRLLVHGLSRVSVKSITRRRPYLTAKIDPAIEIHTSKSVEIEALRKKMMEVLNQAVSLANLSDDLLIAALNIEDPGKLADLVASNIQLNPSQLRRVLQELDVKIRLEEIFKIVSREVTVMEIGNNISEKVRDSVDQNQREYYLREQIRVMQNELGESDPVESDLEELRKRLELKEMPDYARKIAEKELNRLAMLQPAAAEYGVIRTYVETILDLPFVEKTDDHIDLIRAAEVLDEDHYGLDKVKERILEFLSVIRLKGGALKGPILCLVGPPGVGKTSLGKSIARATGRKFQRFSLGGMRDEAEIRGHRRTYIGAMPGRIIKSLMDSKTVNPLIMLDEIDKIGSDFRGDPSSALLEVLDPEQNDTFGDHYMDMPVDLSNVMFITTANSLDTIPGPLRDRMEIIRIAGYTPNEKLEIAKRYLVKEETSNAGLNTKQIRYNVGGLRHLIDEYTSEAGVRGLKKQIASIARKVARNIAEEESRVERSKSKKSKAKKNTKQTPVSISEEKVTELLGPSVVRMDMAEKHGQPGIATGLAWTPVGGDILFIETSLYPGKGNFKLTGQLGDVMKESAAAAVTYLRSNRDLIGVDDKVFAENDFHLHVPAGATPKDGPSAGVAMAAAVASLLRKEPLRDLIAMTGEISLRGNVLPVGGIKEKVLAAHRSGIKEILLPEKNRSDLEEIPESVRKALKFHFLKRIEDVLEIVFAQPKKQRKATKKSSNENNNQKETSKQKSVRKSTNRGSSGARVAGENDV